MGKDETENSLTHTIHGIFFCQIYEVNVDINAWLGGKTKLHSRDLEGEQTRVLHTSEAGLYIVQV